MRCLIAFSLLLASCSSRETPPASTAARPVAVGATEVLAAAPQTQWHEASGLIEARSRTTVSAQLMGRIERLPVAVGQAVKAGQVLVILDSQQVSTLASQAEAGRLEARSALPEADAAIAAASTQLELARTTQSRLARLFERQSLTSQEMDEANARLRQAEAALSMARARRTQIEARIAQADQVVALAGTQKSYATISAPFDAVVTEKLTEIGSMAMPGAPLLALERASGFRASLSVDEVQARGLRLGLPIRVAIEGGEFREVPITEIVPSLDPSTRTMIIRADLPQSRALRTGMYVRARWPAGEREILSVPVKAVRENGQLQMVVVIEEGQPRTRMVSLGEVYGDRREVLSGLKAGERIQIEVQP